MTYAPNVFSTKGSLSRTIVLGWIAQNDHATIDQWLTQGEPHPRLASEAIVAALETGKVDLANRVWAAGWHKPSQTFDDAWRTLRTHAYALGQKKGAPRPDVSRSIDWLEQKSRTPNATGKLAKVENAARIAALEAAFFMDREDVWDRFLTGTDLSSAEGSQLFSSLSNHLSHWPNPYAHPRPPAPAWIEARFLDDMFSHGLRPGGSVWVGAATHECARPLLAQLMSRVDVLTTPRMRAAIIIHAAENKCPGLDELMRGFIPLGVPEEISLTKSEIKRAAGQSTSGVYLEDRANDHAFTGFVWRPHQASQFDGDAAEEPARLQGALGADAWASFKRQCLQEVADQATPSSRPALRPRGM